MSWTGYGVDEVLGPHLFKLILGAIKTGLDLHKCQSGIKCLAACPLGRKNAMTGSTGRMHRARVGAASGPQHTPGSPGRGRASSYPAGRQVRPGQVRSHEAEV